MDLEPSLTFVNLILSVNLLVNAMVLEPKRRCIDCGKSVNLLVNAMVLELNPCGLSL